jgi:hypothetical protein
VKAGLALVAILCLPLIEVGAHVATRAAVPTRAEYQQAAAYVRSQLQPKDLIVAAPGWTDPLVRAQLGDRMDLAMAGRSDVAAYERLWSLSIRGARPVDAPKSAPLEQREFGGVRVQRWSLPPSSVAFDFTAHAQQAEVSVGTRACRWQKLRPARGGGLGYGVLPPVERFQCDGRGPWVAAVVMEDLDLQPRHCIFQPPGVGTPSRVVFRGVELREQLSFYGGVYYEHERMRQGPPIFATVHVNGKPIGRMQHRDGDGWERLLLPTQPGWAEVAIDVVSSTKKQRSFCWAASVRTQGAR